MIEDKLLAEIGQVKYSPAQALSLLDHASRYWANSNRIIAEDVELVVRLMDKREILDTALPGARLVINALARESGLYPYIDDHAVFREQLLKEIHRIPNMENLIFHSGQFAVFRKLLRGDNIILSAPTSFGKTLIVDALIASKEPHIVLIIVPTIALLEERRRTLATLFPDYQIITQTFQEIRKEFAIFIGTQERIIERGEIPAPDLFVVDEFYKLDLTRNDVRAKSLNKVLAQYIDKSKQVYLLGPSIYQNPVNADERPNLQFISTRYSPVAADIIRVDPPGTDPDVLYDLLYNKIGGASLIYCRSPKSSRTLARSLAKSGWDSGNEFVRNIADWLRENYHERWYVAEALERGIGIHHGRVPRAIGHLMVKLFNTGNISALICTSSLIEGVNTVAENVVIYDKYIHTRSLDRFTFDNIKGRAGRMFKHFVGKIYLFNPAPEPYYEALDIPLLQSRDNFSDDLLVQVSDDSLSDQAKSRKRQIFSGSDVPEQIIKRYSAFGISALESLWLELSDLIDHGDNSLFWSGYPSFPQILQSMEFLWSRLDFDKHNIKSARQFAHFSNILRRSQSIKRFLENIIGPDDLDGDIDLAFSFLRGAEYSFAEPLRLLEEVLNELTADNSDQNSADYGKFISDLVSWGLPERSKALEELGVPAPIIQKLASHIDVHDPEQGLEDVRRHMTYRTSTLSDTDIEVLDLTLA